MTAYTNTRNNSTLPGVGFKDGDTLTTANGSKWVWQNESWFPVMFAGNPDVQPLTASTNSSGEIGNTLGLTRGGPVIGSGASAYSFAQQGTANEPWNIAPAWDIANVTADISAGLTASVDYAVTYQGQPTIRIDIPAGTSGVKKLLATTGATCRIPEGWDAKNLCIATRSSNGAMIQTSIAMYVGDAGNTNVWMKDQDRVGHPDGVAWYSQPNEWRHWKVGTEAAGPTAMPVSAGAPVATRLMRVRVMANLAASASAESIWIGFFGPLPARKKGTIVITLDDGYETWHSYIAPLARYYDIPVTMAMVGGLIGTGNKMSVSQARQLAADATGLFDMVSHTYDHVYIKDPAGNMLMTEDAYLDNADKNAAFLRDTIGVRGDGPMHLFYPGGRTTFELFRKARERGYLAGRGAVRYCWQNGQDQTLGHNEDLGRYVSSVLCEIGNQTTVAEAKAAIDQCAARKEMGVLLGHTYGTVNTDLVWTRDNLEQIFAYLAAKRDAGGIEIKSWTRWWADLTGRPCDLR